MDQELFLLIDEMTPSESGRVLANLLDEHEYYLALIVMHKTEDMSVDGIRNMIWECKDSATRSSFYLLYFFCAIGITRKVPQQLLRSFGPRHLDSIFTNEHIKRVAGYYSARRDFWFEQKDVARLMLYLRLINIGHLRIANGTKNDDYKKNRFVRVVSVLDEKLRHKIVCKVYGVEKPRDLEGVMAQVLKDNRTFNQALRRNKHQ